MGRQDQRSEQCYTVLLVEKLLETTRFLIFGLYAAEKYMSDEVAVRQWNSFIVNYEITGLTVCNFGCYEQKLYSGMHSLLLNVLKLYILSFE